MLLDVGEGAAQAQARALDGVGLVGVGVEQGGDLIPTAFEDRVEDLVLVLEIVVSLTLV